MEKTILGQNFRFGYYDVPPAERMDAIRHARFDAVMFWWGGEYEETDGSRYALFDLAQKNGLLCRTVHYPSTHADWLWHDDLNGASYEEQFRRALADCGERGIRNLVVHTTRKFITPPPNEIGAARFRRLADAAEQAGVTVALENTRFLEYNRYLLARVKSDAVGFCFDCGHAHCYTPIEDPLGEFGSRLATTHIHDNDGGSDEHHPMGEGTVNYADVFARLCALGARELNLESYCNETSLCYRNSVPMDEYLQKTHDRLARTAIKHGFELASQV
ncbi:MAG: sugar phosphate isomerase/epimerase [Ruminococcus sp.]|nr:sugar phosphate isomerase/epimerase [Candidatus Apopatosoma intestinale]